MAFALDDRVKETSTTTGTGTITLAGAVTAFQAFSAGVGDANTTFYSIAHQTADEWEVGIGTYTLAGTTLSRDTILASSNSDAAVNFSAGTKDVFVTQPASRAVTVDDAGVITITAAIATSSTVDGRDVAADGSKLDGIESLADVTDATNVNAAGATMNTDFLAKGSVLTASGASTPVSLAVGADDQVLTADAAEATGVKWAAGGGGGGLSNIVEDLTPQLGGQLDVNGFAIGNGTRELITFVEDGSAVNQVEIENQATGSGPIIRAAGDDTNIDLVIDGKGTGNVAIQSSDLVLTGTGANIGIGTANPDRQIDIVPPVSTAGSVIVQTNGALASFVVDRIGGGGFTMCGSFGAVTGFGFEDASTFSIFSVNETDPRSATFGIKKTYLEVNAAGLLTLGQSDFGAFSGINITTSGNLGIGLGTGISGRKIFARATESATNTVTPVIRIGVDSTGTPANGIGCSMEFHVETSGGNREVLATIEAVATDTTSTSEDGDLVINTMSAGATATEKIRIGVGGVNLSDRIQGLKGSDVASADEITLGAGNYFDITGTTAINHINNTNWQAGAVVTLQFDSNPTVGHNAAVPTGTEASILLSGAASFSATANDTLTLVYDGVTFREIARAVI